MGKYSKYTKVILFLAVLAFIPLVVGGCTAKKATTVPTPTPAHIMSSIELTSNFTTLAGTVGTQGGALTNLANRVGALETAPVNLNGVNANISALQALASTLGVNVAALQSVSLNAAVLNQSIFNWFNSSTISRPSWMANISSSNLTSLMATVLENMASDGTGGSADLSGVNATIAALAARVTALENTGVLNYNLAYINASVWTLTHVPAVPPVITATLETGATWSNGSYFVFCSAHDSVSSATLTYTWSASPNSLQVVPWLVPNQILWYLPTTITGLPVSGSYTITCAVSDGIGGNTSATTTMTK